MPIMHNTRVIQIHKFENFVTPTPEENELKIEMYVCALVNI